MKVKKVGNYIEINGQWYFPTQRSPKDKKDILFKEVDKEKIKMNLDFLLGKLEGYVDKRMLLEDALAELKPKELEKLCKALEGDKKPKVKHYYGCVIMNVGGVEIQLR